MQRQAISLVSHPSSLDFSALSMLLAQVWPQAGRSEMLWAMAAVARLATANRTDFMLMDEFVHDLKAQNLVGKIELILWQGRWCEQML